MLNLAKRDYLRDTFIYPIALLPHVVDRMRTAVFHNKFGQFRRIIGNEIGEINRLIYDDNLRANGIDWAYIVFVLWVNFGGNPESVLHNPDSLREHYEIFVNDFAAFGKNEAVFEILSTSPEMEQTEMTPVQIEIPAAIVAALHDTPLDTRMFIYGQDTLAMSNEEIIHAIERTRAKIESLRRLDVSSTHIEQRCVMWENAIESMVAILDNRG